VRAGQVVGLMGRSGDASACHLHFGVSTRCPGKEWAVRRGVVWPQPYLDSWRTGGTASPAAAVTAWAKANPGACAAAMRDPHAPDA
jgi:murein DD-endopeptidase MepM/ murein hydrolase activator NlpD